MTPERKAALDHIRAQLAERNMDQERDENDRDLAAQWIVAIEERSFRLGLTIGAVLVALAVLWSQVRP